MSPARREGWKEIAAHFGVGVRTVQIWEAERCLPVRRLPGPRGRVYAEVSEIEAWRLSLLDGLPKEAERESRLPWPGIALASLILLIAASCWYWRIQRSRQPSDFKTVGSHLIVLDQHGQSLFEQLFGAPVFQGWDKDGYHGPPRPLDIDGDGDREFLFPWKQGETAAETDQLLCFSRTGRPLWTFSAGKPVHAGKDGFGLPFRISQFEPVNLGGGRRALVVTAHHQMHFPMQVALIGLDGRLIREYWHSGQLNSLLVTDFDADGVDEIYVGGCANGPKRAALVRLDPRTMDGASAEQTTEYQLQDFSHPVETARLFLERSQLNQNCCLYNSIIRLFRESDYLVAEVQEVPQNVGNSVVFHRFDARLRHAGVSAGDSMILNHQRIVDQGLTSVTLADDLKRIAEPEWITRPRP